MWLQLARAGYAATLAREAADAGLAVAAQGASWVETAAPAAGSPAADGLCFAHTALVEPAALRGASVNATARALLDWFLETCRGETFARGWPVAFQAEESEPGLARRVAAVEKEFRAGLAKRLARVARLAEPRERQPRGRVRGLFVFFRNFERAEAAREAVLGGQQRMADDPGAPSRSYLKVEEAYGVLGRAPTTSETVADLGAAPGGWSYSAARRGAEVLALDNGPLKGAALGHPRIRHERADAFRFAPAPGEVFGWLFCDVVDDPRKVLILIEKWTHNGWCRRLVVNLKFGRTDPLPLLRLTTGLGARLTQRCRLLRARHLFHDREEFTLVGEVRPE